MKKLYTVFLMAVVAMVCSMGLSAQSSLNLVLNCDRDNAVQWKGSYYAEWQTLAAGENAIALPYDYGYTLMLQPVEGFRIDQMISQDPDSYTDQSISSPLSTNYIYPDESWSGRKYNIVTSDMNEMRSAKVTVNITDNPARFTVRRSGGGSSFSFQNVGANELAFDPETELPIEFNVVGREPLYIVKLDGTDVRASASNSYSFPTLTDGQVIDVTANWPTDMKTEITITTPEGLEGSVSDFALMEGYTPTPVDYKVNEPFEVQAGKYYNITFNKSEYTINKVTLDGAEQYVYTGLQFWVGEKPVKVEVDAAVKAVPKFYLSTARDNEVQYSKNGYTFTKLPAGQTEIIPEESWGGWSAVYVKAADGFRMTSIECAEAGDSYVMPDDPSQSVALNPANDWLGRVYEIKAANLDEERTASVTVTVTDDPTKVAAAKRGASRIELGAAGESKVFKFNPESSENVFSFSGNLVPLNSVKLNGTSVLPDNAESVTHTLTVKDGDNIEITAGYPEVNVPVTINVDPAVAGVVSGVSLYKGLYDQQSLTFTPGEPFEVPAGSKINLTYDTNAFNLKSVKIGDRELGRYAAVFVLNDPVDIDIDAAAWRDFSFVINVADPTLVDVYEGSATYGATPYELVAGENHLTIPEKQGCITIKPKSGYQLNSVTDADGNPYTPAEGLTNVFNITESDMVFNINIGELQYDSKWVFWLDSADNLETPTGSAMWGSSESMSSYNNLLPGYNVNEYASALQEEFIFSLYLLNGYYLYLNGDLYKTPEHNNTCYVYFTPENKIDVFRMYTTGEPAEKYDLTFTVSGDKAKETKVVTDMIVEQSAWTEGLSLLEQTRVELTLPDDAENVAVKLDETPLEANEDGKYVFDTTGAHNVTISTSSSILDLDADMESDNNAVYNLMGVKLLDNASAADLKRLPAGVYVVNGEKKVIR